MGVMPINIDADGCARCIRAGYYKMYWTNFTRELLGKNDGVAATGILEVYEDD